jgi:membrane-associated protein
MVPSEAAVLAAGVFSHAGRPSMSLIVVATALGVFVGDHLAYGLSRSVFGPRLIGRSEHVSRAVAAAGRRLDGRAGLLIVISRFLPGGRVTVNAACGTAGIPLSQFSPASAVAALAWAAYMGGAGLPGRRGVRREPPPRPRRRHRALDRLREHHRADPPPGDPPVGVVGGNRWRDVRSRVSIGPFT